jgi:hypothetical protein
MSRSLDDSRNLRLYVQNMSLSNPADGYESVTR